MKNWETATYDDWVREYSILVEKVWDKLESGGFEQNFIPSELDSLMIGTRDKIVGIQNLSDTVSDKYKWEYNGLLNGRLAKIRSFLD